MGHQTHPPLHPDSRRVRRAGTGHDYLSSRSPEPLPAFRRLSLPQPSPRRQLPGHEWRQGSSFPAALRWAGEQGGGYEQPASSPTPEKKKPNTPPPPTPHNSQVEQANRERCCAALPGVRPARPSCAYSLSSRPGLTEKVPGSGWGSHSRSRFVFSLLDRHLRSESWLLGGENTVSGGREKKNTASKIPLD